MDPRAFLARARAQFEERLAAVTSDHLERPTPCTDWTVDTLVKHVILGDHMATALLAGASRDEVLTMMSEATIGGDLAGEFRSSADRMAAAFGEEGALDRVCHHPGGDVSGVVLLRFRAGDYTYHAWDLARATGQDETLDPAVVAPIWEVANGRHQRMVASGMFGEGPSGTVGEDAPLQHRLLDLSGRRP